LICSFKDDEAHKGLRTHQCGPKLPKGARKVRSVLEIAPLAAGSMESCYEG
jgi:hypothetical protein